MKNAMKAPLVRWAGATALGVGLCATLLMSSLRPASASDATSPDSVADMIRAAHSATSAEVFIVPRTVYTVKQIDQDEVPGYGCLHKVGQGGMAGLLAVIDRADIKNQSIPKKHFDVRILIRLHNGDGATTTIAFATLSLPDDDLRGLVNGVAASASADFSQNLKLWAAGQGAATHPSNISCP